MQGYLPKIDTILKTQITPLLIFTNQCGVALQGTFDFFVNNFNNRDNADVPFKARREAWPRWKSPAR